MVSFGACSSEGRGRGRKEEEGGEKQGEEEREGWGEGRCGGDPKTWRDVSLGAVMDTVQSMTMDIEEEGDKRAEHQRQQQLQLQPDQLNQLVIHPGTAIAG